MSLSQSDIDRRVMSAQALLFDISQSTTDDIKLVVKSHSDAIGSPLEFIYFPLLSLTAHFMGPGCRVIVNED